MTKPVAVFRSVVIGDLTPLLSPIFLAGIGIIDIMVVVPVCIVCTVPVVSAVPV
jgi:hypothetical protein